MINQLLFLFVSFLLSFILYPLWISFVYKYHMGDDIRGDGPESHLKKIGTPTMGGFIFLLVVSVITLLFNVSRTQTLFPLFVTSLAGFLGLLDDFRKVYRHSNFFAFKFFNKPVVINYPTHIFTKLLTAPWSLFKEASRLVGSSDDGKGVKTYQKFLFQGTISGFVAYWTYVKLGWDFLWFPLIGDVHLGLIYPIFIFLLFMSVLNFVAFTDGVDGLAGGLSLFAFGAYWVIAVALGYYSLGVFISTFIGALLPFIYFNVYPARIFMGNVGSHVLGAILVLLGIVMHREIASIFILAVFLFDGFSSPLQQLSVKFTGKRIFKMAPFHHHFEILGWPESKVTFRFWIFGMIFAFLGTFIALL